MTIQELINKAADLPPQQQRTSRNGQQPPRMQRQQPSVAIGQALRTLGYTFRLNLANDMIECNGKHIDDVLMSRIRTQMRDLDVRPITAVEDVIVTEASDNAYHPVQDYLNALVWDGQRHIATLASYFTSSDPQIVYPSGATRALHHVYLFRWLVGAVAKAMDGYQNQNMMLVLAGPQGLGKSRFANWLCANVPGVFIESPLSVGERDTDVRLMSNFVWEVSELDGTTRKADVSALKAFITKQRVSVRKAYGRNDTIKPALASFIGTVNDGSGFLADETGSRRFWVTTITGLDWRYTTLNVDQVWAEAVHCYRTMEGKPWLLTADEATARDAQNRHHETESVLEGWLARHFYLDAEERCRMTASEIVDHLHSKEIRLSGTERAQAMEISRVLAHLGVARCRTEVNGTTWRGYKGIAPKD